MREFNTLTWITNVSFLNYRTVEKLIYFIEVLSIYMRESATLVWMTKSKFLFQLQNCGKVNLLQRSLVYLIINLKLTKCNFFRLKNCRKENLLQKECLLLLQG